MMRIGVTLDVVIVEATGHTQIVEVPMGPTWIRAGDRWFVRLGEAYDVEGRKQSRVIFAERPEPQFASPTRVTYFDIMALEEIQTETAG